MGHTSEKSNEIWAYFITLYMVEIRREVTSATKIYLRFLVSWLHEPPKLFHIFPTFPRNYRKTDFCQKQLKLQGSLSCTIKPLHIFSLCEKVPFSIRKQFLNGKWLALAENSNRKWPFSITLYMVGLVELNNFASSHFFFV